MPSRHLFIGVVVLVVLLMAGAGWAADAALAVRRPPAADRQSVEGHQLAGPLLLPDDQRDLPVDRALDPRHRRLRAAPIRRSRPGLADVLDGGLAVFRPPPVVRR